MTRKSARFSLSTDQDLFECRTGNAYILPGGGNATLLEFMYRCNHSLIVGLFSRDHTGTFQIPILALNPSDNWNYIYINLTDIVSSNAAFIDHRPYFGFLREDGFQGEIEVYLDNIRLIH